MGDEHCDEHCVWTKNYSFCNLLKKKGVPLDNKWPHLFLGLRSAPFNPLYTAEQKAELQNILIESMGRGKFTETDYYELQKRIIDVIVSPMQEKMQDIATEVQSITVEVNQLLGKHTDDVSVMAEKVDQGISSGKEPRETLTELRSTLRAVVRSFEADRARFESLSFIDSLTRLANRRKFDIRLQEAVLARETANLPVSLILFDIDRFKNVNDTYGHLVGDQILASVAKVIKHTLKTLDADEFLAARYGGDEFAIVLQGPVANKIQSLCEALRKAVANARFTIKTVGKQGKEVEVKATISLGASTLATRTFQKGARLLIDGADKALYYAKASGRNRSVFYSPVQGGSYVTLSDNDGNGNT